MSDMENGIALVLVGVFWVCKAYIFTHKDISLIVKYEMSDMENGITLVLVGVFWVCKAYIAGKDVLEEYYNIASVSTYVFGYLFHYLVEWVSDALKLIYS